MRVARWRCSTGSTDRSGPVGSAAAITPAVATVDTVIASNVATRRSRSKAPTRQGPTPFTAKLEKDKPYKVKVSAPGIVAEELDVKGGQDKVTAKLVAKPRVIAVSSDPQGAAILLDGAPTGKQTPAEIPLSNAQAAKPKLHVQLRQAATSRSTRSSTPAGSPRTTRAWSRRSTSSWR